jgi:hypothetical protein
LTTRHVLPSWGEVSAGAITRSDVRVLFGKIDAPILANQILASASAVFSWAVKQEILTNNPCRGVERNATVSRERVLSETELPLFWQAGVQQRWSTRNGVAMFVVDGPTAGRSRAHAMGAHQR